MKKKNKTIGKNILLIVVLGIVILSIIFLESIKTPATDAEIVKVSKDSNETRINEKAKKYDPAIELVRPDGYINTDYVDIKSNIGKKVILVDFWTYSCINCQRTLPYMNSWQEKYADDGLLIIGVHTPEFDFEKDYDNVLAATKKYGVEYPVILDNNRQTWTAYNNRYWPRKYLIDIDGFIVYDHIGEGSYEETERKIQELLNERSEVLAMNMTINDELTKEGQYNYQVRTPELYFGYGFYRGNLGNKEGVLKEQVVSYKLPAIITQNTFNLEGDWYNANDYMELRSNTGKVVLNYYAGEVNIVASGNDSIVVMLDGNKVDSEHAGNDLKDSSSQINQEDLYRLVENTQGEHVIEIDAKNGFRIYTFTFG